MLHPLCGSHEEIEQLFIWNPTVAKVLIIPTRKTQNRNRTENNKNYEIAKQKQRKKQRRTLDFFQELFQKSNSSPGVEREIPKRALSLQKAKTVQDYTIHSNLKAKVSTNERQSQRKVNDRAQDWRDLIHQNNHLPEYCYFPRKLFPRCSNDLNGNLLLCFSICNATSANSKTSKSKKNNNLKHIALPHTHSNPQHHLPSDFRVPRNTVPKPPAPSTPGPKANRSLGIYKRAKIT